MASEYFKWKFRDVQPEQKVELTPQQKRRNWWHYHKWHMLIGIVLLAAGVDILLHVLGVGRVEPDYQFAYVGAAPLPDATAAALEEALAGLGEDCNGDGKVTVQINQYAGGTGDDANAAYYTMAATTKIMADISACESYFFLLDDPEEFQRGYGALRPLAGDLPADAGAPWEACCLRWTDCPALTALELGQYEERMLNNEVSGENQQLLSGLYLARRGFWTEETSAHVEACDALWDRLTEGANP